MRNKLFYLVTILLVIFVGLAFFFFLPKDDIKSPNNTDRPLDLMEAYKGCVKNFPSELCGMFSAEIRTELYEVCSKFETPLTELDTTLYPDNKLAVARWQDGEEYITAYLPYEPETGFNGCSESAKMLLKHIQESAP